jgi:hypothetical protein
MAGGDMADLVTDHPGHVGLALHVGQDAARDVDVATGQCKGVDLGAVQDGESPGQVRAVGVACQLLPDLVHIGLQLHILIGTVGLEDLAVGLLALGDLHRLVHDRALGLTCDRIDDGGATTRQHQRGQADQDQFSQRHVISLWTPFGLAQSRCIAMHASMARVLCSRVRSTRKSRKARVR